MRHIYVSFVSIAFVSILLRPAAFAQTPQPGYDTSPGAQTGQQVFGSYFSSDIDTVGVYNGNVLLQIGLISLPGREISIHLGVSYNSQKWEQVDCGGVACGEYTGGWRLTDNFGSPPHAINVLPIVRREATLLTGCTTTPQYELDAYWVDGFGTKHRYKAVVNGGGTCSDPQAPSWNSQTLPNLDTDASIYSTDASGIEAITYKNGSVLRVTPPVQITTVNGN